MHIKKTWRSPNGVDLPYIIQVDNPKYKIGIFGDSFAQIAENAQSDKLIWQGQKEPIFNHESTWQYFLSNLLNVETHSYGISCASMGDIAEILLSSFSNIYDFYIIFHTDIHRRNIFAKTEYNASIFKKINNFLSDKKVLNVYWDKDHKLKSFGNLEYVTNFHVTNSNRGEIRWGPKINLNPFDIGTSYCHMSARGNLLLAIELHKIIASSF
jgi:hypothetical protein